MFLVNVTFGSALALRVVTARLSRQFPKGTSASGIFGSQEGTDFGDNFLL